MSYSWEHSFFFSASIGTMEKRGGVKMKIALIAHDRKKELMVKMVTRLSRKSWHSINYMPQEQTGKRIQESYGTIRSSL